MHEALLLETFRNFGGQDTCLQNLQELDPTTNLLYFKKLSHIVSEAALGITNTV